MLELLEQQQTLTLNQWKIITAAILGDMLDFFDFFLIGFVLAFIVGAWHLTYGQSAWILLSAGIGAIPGAFFWGWMADKIGRRKVFILTALNFSIATGIMALTPDKGGWVFLSVFRFFVGVGVAGLVVVDLPLVQEFVPSSKRGWVGGLVTSTVSVGGMLGALSGAYLEPLIGWRGLFAIGLLPALLTLLIRAWVPESPRWLLRKGRREEARHSIAWALEVDPETIDLPESLPELEPVLWRELFRYPRSVFLTALTGLSQTSGVGLALWATTLLMMILRIRPDEASYLMIWVGVTAFVGRLCCAALADTIGRRASGILACSGAAVTLVLAGYSRQRLYRRRVGILADADGAQLFWRRLLFDHRAVHGRGVADGIARERHGVRLWRRQSRQDHQPAGPGADRRHLELCQAGGDRRRDRAGDAVSGVLGGAGCTRLFADRPRNQGSLDRGNRPRPDQAGRGGPTRRKPAAA